MTNSAFTKADLGKARPSLIPVTFRRCLREAEEDTPAPGMPTIEDVYYILEKYEEGEAYLTVGTSTIIQASQYLGKLVGNSLGSTFLMGMAHVFTMGAKKYSVDNWMKCPYEERSRYVDAFYRHAYAWESGEELDEESGLHHLFHAGCCLAMLHGIGLIEQRAQKGATVK